MRRMPAVALALVGLLLAGCTPAQSGVASPVPTPTTSPSTEPEGPVQPVGQAEVVAEGLQAPWSVVHLEGASLLSERDTARVLELSPEGDLREAGVIEGVAPAGEGGLLGLATLVDGDITYLYAYYTSADDNRIVRMPLSGEPGALRLGAQEVVLEGIAKAGNHNGGRIAFGPDGMLYATVGDASAPDLAQDPESLNGKILRMTPEGEVPDGAESLVHSLGHRNPQGLAWDEAGRMWAAEFGQNTWDELNLIEAGANYGWPVVEGIGGDEAFVNPVQQWSTDEASPSGLTAIRGTLFLAGLRGERVWAIYPDEDPVYAAAWFVGEHGRIRDVLPSPDGQSLWVLTNNTDGRGDPGDDDDRLLQYRLAPPTEG